jgi:hypothetical protein
MKFLFGSRAGIIAGALATAAVAMALVASTAAASVVPATWTTTGSVEFKGSLKLTKTGALPKTCTVAHHATALNETGRGLLTGDWFLLKGYCEGGGEIQMAMWQNPLEWDSASGYLLRFAHLTSELFSPYGQYSTAQFTVPFTNGSGGTKSSITFSETVIGYYGGNAIKAAGTLTISDGSTGTRTLTH